MWDCIKYYISDFVNALLSRLNIIEALVLGWYTGEIQATDVVWNKSFKKQKITKLHDE